MLYDDVLNDKNYVGFKRVTEDRELRKCNRRWSHRPVAYMMQQMTLVICKLVFHLPNANTALDTDR